MHETLYLKERKSTSALHNHLGKKGDVYSHRLKAKMIEVTKEHIPFLSGITLIHFTFLSLQEGHSKGIIV